MRELTAARKAIGIDVGSHSVKAVVAAKKGASLVIRDFLEVPIQRSGPAQPDQLGEAVEELGRRLKIRSEVVVASISTQQAGVRNLEIPFSQEDKARQILKFQTEPHLAYPIEEVIVDFYDTGTATEGKMRVLLTAIHKGVIEDRLKLLTRAKIDPEVVDVDFMAVAGTALQAEPGLRDEAGIVIDLGGSKTIACYIQEGRLLGVRCIPIGGDDFTDAVSREFGVSFEEAEKIKAGQAPSGLSDCDLAEKLSRAFGVVFERLGPELDRTVRYFASQIRGGALERVIVSGGSASLRGLEKFLGETLAARVSVLSPSENARIKTPEGMPFARFATAIGLALRGLGEGPCLQNFRQEEHAYPWPYRRLRKRLVVSAVLTVVTAGLLVFSLFASIDRTGARRSELNFRIQMKRSTIFTGKTPRTNDELENLLEDEKKMLKPFRELRESASPLGVLKDLSTKIAKGMKVEFSDFNYTKSSVPDLPSARARRAGSPSTPTWSGLITLKGTVSSVQDHVKLKEILEGLEYVAVVEDKGTTPAGDNRVNVHFVLRLK